MDNLLKVLVCAAVFTAEVAHADCESDFSRNLKVDKLHEHSGKIAAFFDGCDAIGAPFLKQKLEEACPAAFPTEGTEIEKLNAKLGCVAAQVEALKFIKPQLAALEGANVTNTNEGLGALGTLKDDLEHQLQLAKNVPSAIIKQYQKDNTLAKTFTEDNWYSGFQLGAKMMPEYDENGDNQGFKETNYWGVFTLETRGKVGSKYGHAGVEVEMASESVVDCAEVTDPNDQCNTKSASDLSFNDISDSITASVYVWRSFLDIGEMIELQVGYKYGFKSRDKLDDNSDSINTINGPGLRWAWLDYKAEPDMHNGLPKFVLEYHYMQYEDYAGLGERDRNVIRGFYRPTLQPVLLGLVVNAGEGPDEIALTLTYGIKIEKFFGLAE